MSRAPGVAAPGGNAGQQPIGKVDKVHRVQIDLRRYAGVEDARTVDHWLPADAGRSARFAHRRGGGCTTGATLDEGRPGTCQAERELIPAPLQPESAGGAVRPGHFSLRSAVLAVRPLKHSQPDVDWGCRPWPSEGARNEDRREHRDGG